MLKTVMISLLFSVSKKDFLYKNSSLICNKGRAEGMSKLQSQKYLK